jgi:hypothetical protein
VVLFTPAGGLILAPVMLTSFPFQVLEKEKEKAMLRSFAGAVPTNPKMGVLLENVDISKLGAVLYRR